MSKSSTQFSKLSGVFQSNEKRVNVFYILALIPLILIAYVNILYLSPLMFGFLLLLLKRNNLLNYNEPTGFQRNLGLVLVVISSIIYYILVQIFPNIGFYGAITYIAFVVGLCLTFFSLSALREALTPIFITTAAASISYVSSWLELVFSPYIIPLFTSVVGIVSNSVGVSVTVRYPGSITLHALRGTIPLQVIWGCVGVYGALVFSILLVVILLEEPASLKAKIPWAFIGLIGVLVLNVIRVVIVLTIAYYYDFNVAELAVHPYLGYALFLTWLLLFLSMFSKRQTILRQVKSIPQRLRGIT